MHTIREQLYDSLSIHANCPFEGYGSQYFAAAQSMITMRTIVFQFLLLVLLAVTCSSSGFRSFLGKIQQRRRVNDINNNPDSALYVEEEREMESPEAISTTTTTGSTRSRISLTSSLKESSLLREFWQDISEMSFFNFSLTEDSDALEELNGASGDQRDLEAGVVHFCFLVHGLNGFSQDLSYLQAVMRRTAMDRKQKQQHEEPNKRQDIVVHATVCNERKTDDGVEAGGERLTEEIKAVILKEMRDRGMGNSSEIPLITVSFLGNSLGGLYARYAIADLVEGCQQDPSGHLIFEDKYRLHLNIFCTTATPHLGVAGHTYFPLPRIGEVALAHTMGRAMGQTWRDLFRVNDLIRRMATLSRYVTPMKLFRQRIAYANAYGTDFPVPVHTAAFLHEESDYPHHFVESKMQRLMVEEHADLCTATIYTPPQHHHHSDENFLVTQDDDELAVMSRSLDALGWRKVFVDPRKLVPKISNPIGRAASLRETLTAKFNRSSTRVVGLVMTPISMCSSTTMDGGENCSLTSDSDEDDPPSSPAATMILPEEQPVTMERLKARGVAPSREVFHAVTASPITREHLHWPFGHNMIVAMSRNSVYNRLNKPGRPIVDALATELVDDIFAFTRDNNETQSN